MEIDLGAFGDFVMSRRFWGSLAIGFPVVTIGLFVLYSLVRKVHFLKMIVQYILLTFGLSIIVFAPILFFSAFIEAEKLKLALVFLIIVFFVAIYTLFNQREIILFFKDFSKLKNLNKS